MINTFWHDVNRQINSSVTPCRLTIVLAVIVISRKEYLRGSSEGGHRFMSTDILQIQDRNEYFYSNVLRVLKKKKKKSSDGKILGNKNIQNCNYDRRRIVREGR